MSQMDWWRSWHGAPTDTKWLLIARKAKVPPGVVSAIAWALLDHASQNATRGEVSDFDIETYAVFSGFDEDEIAAVITAMVEKGVIVNGQIAAWEKRQPKAEDGTRAERQKRWRDRQKAKKQGDDTVTDSDDDETGVTGRNALRPLRNRSRSVTVTDNGAEKSREEERREESRIPSSAEGSCYESQYVGPKGDYDLDDDDPFFDREVA